MPPKQCSTCLFSMQEPGEGFHVCVCATSPYAGLKRHGLLCCGKFVSYSEVLTKLKLKANQWQEWNYDGVDYFVALDGKGRLVVFEITPKEEK